MKSIFPQQFINNPEALYRWCNERYWNNDLPNDVDVKYIETNDDPGEFRVKGRMRPHHAITLPAKLKETPDELLSLLVHRQIHVWQTTMSYREQDYSYLDTHAPDWLVQQHSLGRSMRRYHGAAFSSQMDRLNSNFSELNISMDKDKQQERLSMEQGLSLMHVVARRPNGKRGDGIYWCSNPLSDEARDKLKAWASENYHNIVAIRFGQSICESVKEYARLNCDGSPKSRQFPVLYKANESLSQLLDGNELTQWDSDRPPSPYNTSL